MAQVLSEKEVQQLLDSIDKLEEKDAKIEALNLPAEDKNKLDVIIRGIDEFKEGPAEQMAQTFFGIKETFKFSKERVNIIKNEMVGAFAEGQLEKLNFSKEQNDEILKIIMGEEEREEVKEGAEEAEKTEESSEQELFYKAYEQLIRQKEYFLESLDGLKFDDKIVNDIMFFNGGVKEILKILGTDEKEKSFFLTKIADFIRTLLNRKNELIQELEAVDDKKFIDDFERYRNEIIRFVKTWNDFSSTSTFVNYLPEFDLLFSFLKEDNTKITQEVLEKLEPLLKHFGYKQIYPKKGEEYNPREHEVVGEESSVVKRGQVARVVRRGLKKGDEVIQKARVVIGK